MVSSRQQSAGKSYNLVTGLSKILPRCGQVEIFWNDRTEILVNVDTCLLQFT
jgi:hypothetical protein